MKYGYFDDQAREYVITRPDTPRSWTNYLGTTEYGSIVTQNAGGYSFYRSAAQGRFMRFRSNTVPADQPGRYFYLRDRDTGDFWSSSWQPVGKSLASYTSECRHGTAYTVITSEWSGIRSESTYFVPSGQTFEYWRLRVTNRGAAPRKLSVFTYCEFTSNWTMSQDLVNLQYSAYIVRAELRRGLLRLAINDHLPVDPVHFTNNDQSRHLWMGVTGAAVAAHDFDRDAFLGRYGSYAAPEAVVRGACGNHDAFADNACGAFQMDLDLAPGETRELLVLLGVGEAEHEGQAALAVYGNAARCERELAVLKAGWHAKLGAVQVRSPDPAFDSMVNVWNAYNSLITYAWSRAASLVYNGERDGLGYRDTVQDILGVLPMIPEEARQRLELMLTGQLSHGGAMPVVKPFAHRPGRESGPAPEHLRSDDCLWLFNTVPAYVAESGDQAFYRKVLPYADRGEASVLGHLRRALEFNLERTGRNGLPCGLEADWNDCLKLGYHGESVFVAFQVRYGLAVYASIADACGETAEAAWARGLLPALDERIQRVCWDGDRFIWAIGEDGTVYGSRASQEGRLYLNTQVWAVISGAATGEQARTVLDTVRRELATEHGLLLCSPPFVKTPVDVMRAVLFNPGTKENSGIFCHTQSWAVLAEILLGRGDQAYAYYRSFMPSAANERAELREVEPYVHCQSVHGKHSPKFGAGRLPWLSGTASWSYYTATHWILGIRPEADGLRIDPCLPSAWKALEVDRKFRGTLYRIRIENPGAVSRGVARLLVDGRPLSGNLVPPGVPGAVVNVQVTLGEPA